MPKSYPYQISTDAKVFSFISVGPKGQIHKQVQFLPLDARIHRLNLVDLLDNGQPDMTFGATNNGDVFRVMATIVEAIVCFLDLCSDQWILITGESPAHLRLYQRSLTTRWSTESGSYLFYGIQADEQYGPYDPGLNYEAIMIAKRSAVKPTGQNRNDDCVCYG